MEEVRASFKTRLVGQNDPQPPVSDISLQLLKNWGDCGERKSANAHDIYNICKIKNCRTRNIGNSSSAGTGSFPK